MKIEEFDREIGPDFKVDFRGLMRLFSQGRRQNMLANCIGGWYGRKNGNLTQNGKITNMPLELIKGIPNFEWIFGDFIN